MSTIIIHKIELELIFLPSKLNNPRQLMNI